MARTISGRDIFCVRTRKPGSPTVCFINGDKKRKPISRIVMPKEKVTDWRVVDKNYDELMEKMNEPSFNFGEWADRKEEEMKKRGELGKENE